MFVARAEIRPPWWSAVTAKPWCARIGPTRAAGTQIAPVTKWSNAWTACIRHAAISLARLARFAAIRCVKPQIARRNRRRCTRRRSLSSRVRKISCVKLVCFLSVQHATVRCRRKQKRINAKAMLGWTHDSKERGHALSVRPVRPSASNKSMLMAQQAHEIVQQVAFAIALTGRHSMLKKKKFAKDAVTFTLNGTDVQINTRCWLQTVWSPSFFKTFKAGTWQVANVSLTSML